MASLSGHLMSESCEEHAVEEAAQEKRTEPPTLSTPSLRKSTEEVENNSVLYYYRMLQWLENEVEQHKLQLNTIKSLDSVTDDNFTPNKTEELQEKLMKLSTDRSILKSILHSVQLGQTVLDVMFQKNGEVNSKLQTSITELVERTTACVSDVLRIHKENQMLQSSLANVKEECLVLRQENRELMHKLMRLQDLKETQRSVHSEDLEIKRVQKESDTLTAKLELAQFVLQGLVFGSGVNWVKDKKLCYLVPSLGQPIEELLKELVIESGTP